MTTNRTRSGPAEHVRSATGTDLRELYGMVRRFAVTLTSRPFWQLLGHTLLDGTPETHDAEVFSGVGFYARPPAGSKPEAIAVNPGGGAQPVVIATRDEQTRKAIAGELAEGETATFNNLTIVVHRATGKVEIRTPGGTAIPLATLADVQALRSAFNGHTHADPSSGFTGGPLDGAHAPVSAPAPVGTTVLLAE